MRMVSVTASSVTASTYRIVSWSWTLRLRACVVQHLWEYKYVLHVFWLKDTSRAIHHMRSIRLEKCKNVKKDCRVALFVKDKSQASLSPQLPLSRLSSVHFLRSESAWKIHCRCFKGLSPNFVYWFPVDSFIDSFLGEKNSSAERLTTWRGVCTAPLLDDAVESSKVRRHDTHAEQTRRKIWCSGGQARGR